MSKSLKSIGKKFGVQAILEFGASGRLDHRHNSITITIALNNFNKLTFDNKMKWLILRNYNRAVRLHKFVYEVLMRLAWNGFISWVQENQRIDNFLLEGCIKLHTDKKSGDRTPDFHVYTPAC